MRGRAARSGACLINIYPGSMKSLELTTRPLLAQHEWIYGLFVSKNTVCGRLGHFAGRARDVDVLGAGHCTRSHVEAHGVGRIA